MKFKGKKLLILGGNPETVPLVRTANEMGIHTVVTDDNPIAMAKRFASKSHNVDGLDVPGLIALARDEKVDGVLVGVADILVSSYRKVCDALGLPCYATHEIIDTFTLKDKFKAKCREYGVHVIPEYHLDANLREEDVSRIEFPVIIKPVDNGGGVGITVCHSRDELQPAVSKALNNSGCKRFIVEKYMTCEDVAIYYTIIDGEICVSSMADRFTTGEQPGFSRVCLGAVYPSKYLDLYFERMHDNMCRMLRGIGVTNGVLLLSAFCENGEFYVYDPGFRLQGEAPHLILAAVNGFDHRRMLVEFALTGSMGEREFPAKNDARLHGKAAGSIWFLLRSGRISCIRGMDELQADPNVVNVVQRLNEGDEVPASWIGNEKQVLMRVYIVCDTRADYRKVASRLQQSITVSDTHGNDMLIKGFDLRNAWN